jgi:predicted DNA-binding transcriptional regulator AlpA
MAEDTYTYLRPPEAAAYLKISTSTLAKKRLYGDGPKFARWGKAIRYRREDLDAYMAAQVVHSTSERLATASVETAPQHSDQRRGESRVASHRQNSSQE